MVERSRSAALRSERRQPSSSKRSIALTSFSPSASVFLNALLVALTAAVTAFEPFSQLVRPRNSVKFRGRATVDVLSTIKKEHREVAALIDEAAQCEPGDQRLLELAHAIESQLSLHLSVEERLFYATLRDRAEEQDERVDVFEAYTEHEVAKRLMAMLASARKPDERFKAELQVLGENVKHHVREEESKVFGVAREVLSAEELEEIGAAWEKAKQRAAKAGSSNGRRSPARKRTDGARKRSGTRKTAVPR
jgi:hemerythrin-like domain-containing protein